MNILDSNICDDISAKQYVDPTCGILFPWFTKPFLDILATWDLSNADIFEWGAGHSTIWYATKCKSLISVETNKEFYISVKERLIEKNLTNVEFFNFCVDVPEEAPKYVSIIDRNDKKYDYVSIDGSLRNECGVTCVKHLKPGSIVILDNANQLSIGGMNTPIFDALKHCQHFSFLHPWHKFGDWRTDYWIYQNP
jgi:predicted O-methyltransferase YrrM